MRTGLKVRVNYLYARCRQLNKVGAFPVRFANLWTMPTAPTPVEPCPERQLTLCGNDNRKAQTPSLSWITKHSRSTVVITYVTLLPCENVLDAVSPYKYHCLWVHNLLKFVPSKNSDLEKISLIPRPSTPQVIDRLHTRPGNEAREE